jgi:NTE family protein
MFNTLVLSGGGNSGYSYIGVLKSLEDNNLNNFNTIMGTSIGSLFATFIAMGFTAQEILTNIDFSIQYNDIDLDNFFTDFGFFKGNDICENIKKVICVKFNPDITFKELFKITHKKLIITALCLEDKKIEYFSYENHPNLKIIDAIRFSISIPIIFTSKKYNNKYYVDAAMIDNLSITYFNNPKKVLGIKLKRINKKITNNDNEVKTFGKYMYLLYSCITTNLKKDISKYKIIDITIDDNLIDDPIEFKLKIETIKTLINLGYHKTNLFIKKNN